MKRSISAVLAAGIAAVALAAPAQADKYDYVLVLDDNGIYYDSITRVIDLGKQICSVGRTAPIEGTTMMQLLISTMGNAGYAAGEEQAIIATAAANNMCPDVIPRWRASHEWVKQANARDGIA